MMILIENGRLVTRNEQTPYLDDGCVAVEGSKIADYGKTAEMKAKYPQAEALDAKRMVIMPGFINMHQHIYSALARGMQLKNSPVSKDFNEILENLWWRLDRALGLTEIKYSALTTYIEGIKNGVTTVFDHHASAGQIEGSLFEIADAAALLGVRTNLCYEVSDRDGLEKASAGIKENTDFIKYAKQRGEDMMGGLFGLHASFTLSDDTLAASVDAAADCGFHIHVAEGKGDETDSMMKYGMPVVNRLKKNGILGEKTLAIHCIHISDDEMDVLADTKTAVVHNPQSNMGNAVGCADIIKQLKKGVLSGLGTDGYTTDMLMSLKTANILQKHQTGDPSVAWGEPPKMLFKNNATIANRYLKGKIGKIEKDYYADIILMDYDPLTPMDGTNIDGHMHFGISGAMVSMTMINGKIVYKDRALTEIDEAEVFMKSRETAKAFWSRA